MSNFDYKQHKIIAVAKKKYQGNIHATIYPLGYQDSNFHFQPFSREEQKNIFLHNGTVFGYKFPDHLTNELIILHIRKNENNDDTSKDMYLADYQTKIIKYEHSPIVNINKSDLKETIKQGQYNKYYKVGNRIYYITNSDVKKGIAKYFPIEDGLFETNLNICRFEDDIYLIRDDIRYSYKYSDLFTNEEIIKYILEIIKIYNIDPEHTITISKDLVKTLEIPFEILNFRFNTFKEFLPSIILTKKNIYELAANPILTNVIQNSIKKYEDEYIKTFKENNQHIVTKIENEKIKKINNIQNECSKIENAHQMKVQLIKNEIEVEERKLEKITLELEIKTNEITALENRYSSIENQKDRLIADFSIIKDVIGGQNNHKYCNSKIRSIESVSCEGEEITEFDVFRNQIANNLLNNCFSDNCASVLSINLARLFFAKNKYDRNVSVILLPNILIFKSLIDAIGKYNLLSLSVGVNWKAFDDLYFNALEPMLLSSNSNPEKIHILLLQNMNLSYIPSYMQPINDMLIGIGSRFMVGDKLISFPSNLWIFGTRTSMNEEAIPISKLNIEEYGCIEFKEYSYNKDQQKVNVDKKFINMGFVNLQRNEERGYKSYPDSYLD